MTTALFVAAGYLVGSVPFGYWLVRATKHVDIRTVGSGNIGASNVWRAYGWRYGVPVMLFDLAKGLVPALVGDRGRRTARRRAGGRRGHGRATRGRSSSASRGGKAVATAGGTILGVAPVVGLIGAGVWIVVFLLTRYASVASIVSAPRCRSSPGRSASRGR